MTACEQIAGYVGRADWNAILPEARNKLKQHLLDAIGCALGAMGSGPLRAIEEEEKSAACPGTCSLIGGNSASPERAAFYNGALIRYLDFMDAYIAQQEACHPSDNIGAPTTVSSATQ